MVPGVERIAQSSNGPFTHKQKEVCKDHLSQNLVSFKFHQESAGLSKPNKATANYFDFSTCIRSKRGSDSMT